MQTWDVIIVGGGIVGLSLSIALHKRGAKILLVERGEPGREASHAAAGMLADCTLETPSTLQPLAELVVMNTKPGTAKRSATCRLGSRCI